MIYANFLKTKTHIDLLRDIRLEIGKSYYKCYEEVKVVKDNDQETSEGLNQIFEVINAKGDTGEIKEIL